MTNRERREQLQAEISRTVRFIENCAEVDDGFLNKEVAKARRDLLKLVQERDSIKEAQ